MTRYFFSIFPLTCILLGLVGCSSASTSPQVYVVRGKIHQAGVPLELKNVAGQTLGGVQIWLIKEGATPIVKKHATVRPDGSFVFLEGNQPTEGRYQFTMVWQDDYPLGPDKFAGKFDEKNSKIYWNIPAQLDYDIDVSR